MLDKKNLELYVSLWPDLHDFPHFPRFAKDNRLSGVRLNTAMVEIDELDSELELAKSIPNHVPYYFDIKGKQLRVAHAIPDKENLELILNHPISVETPTMVLFKAGADYAMLDKVVDGKHLIFDGGPEFMVYRGESLHIRHPSLQVNGPTFLDYEIEKIEKSKKAGFNKYCLSYTEKQRDVDEFRELVGDSEIIAKIENKNGLYYVQNEFKKQDNLSLMAARGDLYVELDKPHEILDALKLIVRKDKEAWVGSRILLSTIHNAVPDCSDFMDLAWLYDIGYRKMLLCDELCLKEELLARAINVFESFRENYAQKQAFVKEAVSLLRQQPAMMGYPSKKPAVINKNKEGLLQRIFHFH